MTADLLATANRRHRPGRGRSRDVRARIQSWGADPDQARADLDRRVEASPLLRADLT